MQCSLPAVLAVLVGLFVCTVLCKYSSHKHILSKHRDTTLCKTTPGLTKWQIRLCQHLPDATAAAMVGLQQAAKECQLQFKHHRWNCSSLNIKKLNPYTSNIFQKGFRETAFANAISSAGIVISVARACSRGEIQNCYCDKRRKWNKNETWKMGGCSHNVAYGLRFAQKFLDSKERPGDIHSEIYRHNHRIGRMAVKKNMKINCKCHGVSGSCVTKTCWRTVPDFRIVGDVLKEKFQSAVLLEPTNQANRDLKLHKVEKQQKCVILKQWRPQNPKQKRGLCHKLWYYEYSPDFCDADPFLGVWGTSGRSCNSTHKEEGSCSSLCCGRGYNLIKTKISKENCKFIWCCKVECNPYTIDTYVNTCK